MSGLEQAALVIVAVWLAALSLVLLLVVRQMGLMTVRLSFAAPHRPADDAGLDIGTVVPDDIAGLVGGENGFSRTLLFLSATCATCRSIASSLTPSDISDDATILIAGERGRAEGIDRLLPDGGRRLFEPQASRISIGLSVDTVPFGLRIEHGVIASKAYLNSRADLARLVVGDQADEQQASQPSMMRLLRRQHADPEKGTKEEVLNDG